MGTNRRDFLIRTAGSLAGLSLVPEVLRAEPLRLVEPRRIGLIGTGRQGRAMLAELQKMPDVTVTAVCDTSPARLQTGVDRAPGSAGVADYRAVLARTDVDAVLIATPTHLHRQIALDAIATGKHVYLEAPIAHTIADAQAIALAAKGTKSVIYAGFQARANSVYQRAVSLMGSDAMREPVSLYAQWHRKTSLRFPASEPGTDQAVNWRLDPAVTTGLPGEVGAQQFDVALWFRDGRLPARITGSGAVRLHKDGRTVPDTVHADLIWDDGVTLHWQATLGNSFGGVHEIIHAENGAIKLAWSNGWLFKETDAPTQGWEVYATRQQFFNDEGIVLVADATKLSAQEELKKGAGLPWSPLYYALADFLKNTTDGVPSRNPLSDAARATALGILTHQAITSGATVTVPADL
jgi:predicted dehydrogenase